MDAGATVTLPVAESAVEAECACLGRQSRLTVPGSALYLTEDVQGVGLALPVAEIAAQIQGLAQAGSGRRVVPG